MKNNNNYVLMTIYTSKRFMYIDITTTTHTQLYLESKEIYLI